MDKNNSIKQAEKDYKAQQKLVNQAYGEAMGVYNQQAAELAQLQPQYEQSITAGYESQKPILQQGYETQKESLGLQKQATEAGRESALSSARRTYQEGLQRSQQLFGGVGGSSAGQASAEYLGAQTQRNIGQAQQQASQALQGIGIQERDIANNLTNQLQQLEVKKQQDLLKTRDLFRQELNSINSQKASLGLNKANAQLQALSDYNTRKRNIEDFYTQQQASQQNYAFQLAQQAKYGLFNQNVSGNTTPKWTDLKSFGGENQTRSQYLVGLLSTAGGQKALQDQGFVSQGNFIYNPSTGEGYDLFGKRFPDYAINVAIKEGKTPYNYTDYSATYKNQLQ